MEMQTQTKAPNKGVRSWKNWNCYLLNPTRISGMLRWPTGANTQQRPKTLLLGVGEDISSFAGLLAHYTH